MSEPVEFTGRTTEFRQHHVFLASEDVLGCEDVEVEIEKPLHFEECEFQDGRTKKNVLALKLKGTEKLFALNVTNRQRLAYKFGTNKPAEWVGQRFKIYADPNCKKPGERGKTYGLRVRKD